MVGSGGDERGHGGLAFLLRVRAAGMEGAAGGRVERRGRVAGQHQPLAPPPGWRSLRWGKQGESISYCCLIEHRAAEQFFAVVEREDLACGQRALRTGELDRGSVL